MFSKYRLSETLTYGYFEMLGTLSKHAEGIEWAIRNPLYVLLMDVSRLMEKFKFFTAFYHLSELRDREDLITAVITNLDYTMWALGCVDRSCHLLDIKWWTSPYRALESSYIERRRESCHVQCTVHFLYIISTAHTPICDEPPRRSHTRLDHTSRMDASSSFDSNIWSSARSLWIGNPIPWRCLRCYGSTPTCCRNATNDGPSRRNWTSTTAQVCSLPLAYV